MLSNIPNVCIQGSSLGEGALSNSESDRHPTRCVGSRSPSFQSDAAAHPDRLTSDQDEKDSAFPPNPSLFQLIGLSAFRMGAEIGSPSKHSIPSSSIRADMLLDFIEVCRLRFMPPAAVISRSARGASDAPHPDRGGDARSGRMESSAGRRASPDIDRWQYA